MISTLIEKMILNNEATLRRVTHGLTAQFIIPALQNKTNIILGIDVNSFLSVDAAFLNTIGVGVSDLLVTLLNQLLVVDQVPAAATVQGIYAALVNASTLQLQIRVPNSQSFMFILKPEISIDTTHSNNAGTDQIFFNVTLKYPKRHFDTFIVFDKDLYVSLNQCDQSPATNFQAASALLKENVPAKPAPYSLKDDTNLNSLMEIYTNMNAAADPNLKSYMPMPEKYLNASVNPSILAVKSEGIEFYNTTQAVNGNPSYTWQMAGPDNPSDGKLYFEAPYIDFDICALNQKSALRSFNPDKSK